jgi:hypothetical protein
MVWLTLRFYTSVCNQEGRALLWIHFDPPATEPRLEGVRGFLQLIFAPRERFSRKEWISCVIAIGTFDSRSLKTSPSCQTVSDVEEHGSGHVLALETRRDVFGDAQ